MPKWQRFAFAEGSSEANGQAFANAEWFTEANDRQSGSATITRLATERTNGRVVRIRGRATSRRVDRINKRWHRLWKNNFDEGSPERNALSQVDTEEGTNPPTAMEVNTLTQSGLSVAILYVAGGGRSATSLNVVYQIVGVDADFGHARPVIFAGQTIGPFTAGQTINVKTRASNSAVTTPVESAVKTITVT